ncbi:MAG: pyridoxal-phosphate dependent enzyme [Halobacteriales archaeon]|nr:pyridoxal-phosphate dependent enzyme [Halobacteriales archaeon]
MPAHHPVESPDATTVFDYHDLTPPTLADVYAARAVVRRHLPRTPLVRSEPLSAELDAEVYLKREDTLPTGAFKVRGGLALVHDLPAEFHDVGLIAASTGNHGQSVAYAGRVADVPVRIIVPEDANPAKVAAIERYGATVEHHGQDFDEAREHAEALAEAEGFRYVHSANEPRLVAGVATAGLEVVEDRPDVDTVLVPVGGGSGASGYCLTAGRLADARVIGVQSASADALNRAFHEGHLEPQAATETFAEGLATRTPFAVTMGILREGLADFLTVEDRELRRGIFDLLDREGVLAEGAAAAGVAGARALGDELAGETVVIQVSGRNLSTGKLRSVLEEFGG